MDKIKLVKVTFVLLLILVLAMLPATAMVQLPALFADNMVLQRNTRVPMWGTADVGEKITIHIGKKVVNTRAAADGRWHVLLPSMRATTTPFDITITAGNTLTLHNVLVGDVFLCAGQSNMQKPIGPWPGQQPVNNYAQEIAQADYPTIRLFNVAEAQALSPQERCQGQWVVCSPQTAGSFSAAAYFFARQLVQENHVPIGLITASVGGTSAQVWTSIDSLKRTTHFRGVAERGAELSAFASTTALLDGRQISDVANKFKQQWWTTHDPGFTPDPPWTSLDYDDAGWQTTTCPSNLWQYVGFADFEGMIWYRRTVQVPDDWQGKDLLFSFSGYSQEASFYFNGINIDSKHLRQYPDQFVIPAALVKPGKNVFAVRIIGVNGGGGITGDPKEMYLAQADNAENRISLAGPWAYQIGLSLKDLGAFPVTYNAELPGTCFNAMIHPLAPYALKGVLWYQGESDMNGGTHQYYREVLSALIDEWRNLFGQQNLPFLIVQLPNTAAPNPGETRVGNYARVREAQFAVTLSKPNTGLITTIDIGEPDIHPRNKQDVGKRLALMAQGLIYGKRIECWGPLYAGMTIEGNAIRLHFTHSAGGLMTRNGEPVQGFVIAGDNGNYVLAEAIIAGDDVIVSSPKVNKPTVVRYAMWDNPVANLYNKVGLPATPFRTDCADTIASKPVAPATK